MAGDETIEEKKIGLRQPLGCMSDSTAMQNTSRPAIDSLPAFAIVLTPGRDETIIDQTPTPSIQAHRGVGGRCARGKAGSRCSGINGRDACSPYLQGRMQGTVRPATIRGTISRGHVFEGLKIRGTGMAHLFQPLQPPAREKRTKQQSTSCKEDSYLALVGKCGEAKDKS
jgi:hypothetical protein